MKNELKYYRIGVSILLFIVGFNAIFAGMLLILEPEGTTIGLPSELLRFSPFKDFLIPGICLFVLNGVANIAVAVLALIKFRHYPKLITIQGIVLLLWIVTQMIFLREANALQLLMLTLGMIFILVGEFLDENKYPFGRR